MKKSQQIKYKNPLDTSEKKDVDPAIPEEFKKDENKDDDYLKFLEDSFKCKE
jgi:hypothetical protein